MQIINNIIGNSLKYTPEKGKIFIKAQLENTASSNPMIKITIADNGIGIPKNMHDKIFDKYQQVREKDRETGTGLGLAICKNICELHQGSVRVESEEGSGSTFIIILPQALDHAINDPLQKAQDVKHPSILIVDDSDDSIMLIEAKLKKYGHKVIRAMNGQEALNQLEKVMPGLVLLDLDMPIMNGLETLKKIRQKFSSKVLPVIIHSSKITPENIELFRPHANDYIQKPADLNQLLYKIQQHVLSPTNSKTFNYIAPLNILLIDDSEDINALFKLFFKNSSHHLTYSMTAEEGIKLVQEEEFDVIFIDYNLPGINGIEAAKNIKQWALSHQSKIKIALLTATHPDQLKAEAMKAGIDLVLEKKLSREFILAQIDLLIKQGS